MITRDDIGRPVWANDSLGQLVRLRSIPDGRGGYHESAVVRFDNGSEQVFPATKVVVRGQEQRRALCCELAEVGRLVEQLEPMLAEYRRSTCPTWDDVARLRALKAKLMEVVG